MALPKKGLRNITVNNVKYAWSTTGNDGWISLSVIPREHPNCIIKTGFGYHSEMIAERVLPNGEKVQSFKQQIVITGYIVRQVILYAMQIGWDPKGDVRVLNLRGMDDKIDLRIDQNTGAH